MWSIGMYSGNSPLNLQPHPEASNPVLLPGDISDLKGVSIADPFMIQIEDIWYMFFEVLDGDTQKGSIGLATSVDAIKWTYDRIVLDEQVHLSYPCVFRVNQENYMIPETVTGDGISLYRAERFPYEWTLDRVLVEGTLSLIHI